MSKQFTARLVRTLAIVIIASTAGCSSIERSTYLEEFDPPVTYLSMQGEWLPSSAVNAHLVESGMREMKKMYAGATFEGAIRNKGCNSICFFYSPIYSDDLYIVMTTDESQNRFRKMFSFSPLESGSP